MSFSRAKISLALFAKLSKSFQFVTKSQKLRLWSDVPLEERPAMFLHKIKEDYQGAARGLPPVTHLNYELFVYINTKDADAPTAVMDQVLDALDTCFAPEPPTGKVTLGGLCDHVYKDGMGIVMTGDLDGDGIAVIPIKVRVA